jgi:hypothetical protein
MKTRNLLSAAVLAVVALALTLPAVGQSVNGNGSSIHWLIGLNGTNPRNSGTAVYDKTSSGIVPPTSPKTKVVTTFTVQTVTPNLANGSKLDVFIGPATGVNEPYGKLVGIIETDGGLGAMVLIGAKTPSVDKGTTVSVVAHEESAAGELMLQGTF